MASSRTAVMALAGVTSADGSNFPATLVATQATAPRHELGVEIGALGARHRPRRPSAPAGTVAGTRITPSISGASTVAAGHARLVDQHPDASARPGPGAGGR